MWIKELNNCQVHIIPVLRDNYIFVISRGNRALVIDPATASPVIEFLNAHNLILDGILITHKHADHIGGIEGLIGTTPTARVYGPRHNAEFIPCITHKLTDAETWSWESLPIMVLTTPGHTSEHITFYFPSEVAAFVGDVLFPFGCGRVFDGTFEEHYASIKKLARLDDNTLLFCTHEYALNNIEFTLDQARELYQPYELVALERIQEKLKKMRKNNQITVPFDLAQEKVFNPFLRAQNIEVFADLRYLKNSWQPKSEAFLH